MKAVQVVRMGKSGRGWASRVLPVRMMRLLPLRVDWKSPAPLPVEQSLAVLLLVALSRKRLVGVEAWILEFVDSSWLSSEKG